MPRLSTPTRPPTRDGSAGEAPKGMELAQTFRPNDPDNGSHSTLCACDRKRPSMLALLVFCSRLRSRRRIGGPRSTLFFRRLSNHRLPVSALAPIHTSLFQMGGESHGIETLKMARAEAVQSRAHKMVKFRRIQDRFGQRRIELALRGGENCNGFNQAAILGE